MAPIPRVLSIAGSDSGGGAGIQADLKAFAACGVHGMTAITALTAQNTVEVTAVQSVSPEMVLAQVRAVVADIGVDAVKVGMLGTVETIEAVRLALGELERGTPVVLDPVMVAESGAVLLDPSARAALVELLLPLATVATPNLPEARALTGLAHADAGALARAVRELGPRVVVVTGGHAGATGGHAGATGGHAVGATGGHAVGATDYYYDGGDLVEIPGERYDTGAAHGSGCTHSSALAAHLALGYTPLDAARRAKKIASAAVRDGLVSIGAGAGPVDVLGVRRRTRSRV